MAIVQNLSPVFIHIPLLIFTVCVFVLFQCFYNACFHPLASLPGPALARVTRLWARVGNLYGRKSERIHHAHERYGPVVRVAPNEVSFASPAAVKEIYTSASFAKEPVFYHSKKMLHEDHIFSFRDPEAHKQRRKLLGKAFSQSALLEFEPHISSKIQTMLDQWERMTKGVATIDVYPWCHWLGFDVVYHLMLDHDPGSVAAGRPHEVMKYLAAWRPTFIYKEFIPGLPKWGHYVPGIIGRSFTMIRKWKDLNTSLIKSARARSSKNPFLRSAFAEEDGHLGRQLKDEELAEEAMGGMFGGSGTTANTFLYMIWAVARDAHVLRTLQLELERAFPDAYSVPEYQSCCQLPYLQAVINETLRRYPTIVATLPRTAKEDVTIQGVPLPKGTIVGCQAYTLHRDADAFPEPERFSPDRWLETSGVKGIPDSMKEAFVPFSMGPRKCVGINLAYMELYKVSAAFFRRSDVAIHSSMTEKDMEMNDNFSARPQGTKLLLDLKQM